MVVTFWLQALWANLVSSTAPFASSKMEADFQADLRPTTLQMLYTWCLTTALYFLSGFGLFAVQYTPPTASTGYVVVAVCHVVAVGTLIVLPLLVLCVTPLRPHIPTIVPLLVAFLVGVTFLMLQVLTLIATDDALLHQMPVLASLAPNHPDLFAEVHLYIHVELSKKFLLVHMSIVLFLLAILQYIPYTRSVMVLQILIPVALVLSAFLSPAVPAQSRGFMMNTFAPGIISFFQCTQISKMRRKNYEAMYLLQEALTHEADALQKARDLEVLQKEASQKADSILNHILKNIMADAAGTIELFVAGISNEGEQLLDQAIECLHRGMRWCKNRQAIIRIASNSYTPHLVPVSLEDLGKDLVQGRRIALRCMQGMFLLDKTLISIVLDNAINNAYRHGHPSDPEVRFTMSLSPLCNAEDDDRFLLGFEVTNRIHEGRPRVSEEFISRVLAGETEATSTTSLSDNLGLRHIFLAAQAHGMQVSLHQEEDIVTFEAFLETQMCPAFPHIECSDAEEGVLPSGLVVVCMDDSEVARRLLVHTLSKQLPQSRVTAFGEEEEDVERFMCAAIAGAHVVILDQHLTFGQTTILGTAVIERLLACSYRGFIAIRSADSSPEDEVKYLESGVHLMLPKDLRPAELVALLAKGYLRFLHREPVRSAGDLFFPSSKLDTLMSPYSRSPSTFCTNGPNATTGLGYTNLLDASTCCSYSSTCTSHRTSPLVPLDPMPLPGAVNAAYTFHSFSEHTVP